MRREGVGKKRIMLPAMPTVKISRSGLPLKKATAQSIGQMKASGVSALDERGVARFEKAFARLREDGWESSGVKSQPVNFKIDMGRGPGRLGSNVEEPALIANPGLTITPEPALSVNPGHIQHGEPLREQGSGFWKC